MVVGMPGRKGRVVVVGLTEGRPADVVKRGRKGGRVDPGTAVVVGRVAGICPMVRPGRVGLGMGGRRDVVP